MKNFTIFIFCILLSLSVAQAQEILKNGTFDDSTGVWLTEEYGGGDLTWDIVDGVCEIEINAQGTNFWDLQFKQKIEVEEFWAYDISFDISGTGNFDIRVWVQTDHGDFVILDDNTVSVTTEWQTISYTTVEIEINDVDSKITFVLGDVNVGELIFIDNVSMSYSGTLDLKDNTTVQPQNFVLSQNYPNPFNPLTTIDYQLPITSEVEISVFNLLGQKIITLVSEKQPPGTYTIEWNAKDLPSGIYPVRLEAGDPSLDFGHGFVQTRKLILQK